MMKKNIYPLFITTLLLMHHPVPAQQRVTLDTLVSQVLRANPGYRAMQEQVNSAQSRVKQATAWSDPQLSVEFMGTPISSANLFRDAMERKFSVQQMIPFPGKKFSAAQGAQASVGMAQNISASYQRDLVQRVKKEFVMLYAAQERIRVNEESQALVRQMISSVETRYSVAQASQADVLKLQLELEKLRNERASLEHDLKVPVAMINSMRSLRPEADIGLLEDVTLLPFTQNLDALTDRAIGNRPELKAMQFEREMNSAELAMWNRERLPDFMIGAAYVNVAEMTDTYELMLGINLPLAPWSSGKYTGKIEESEIAIRRTDHQIAEMKNMIRFEVYDAWIKAKAHWEIADRLQRSMIPQAEQTLHALLIAYQTHKADFLSLLDSYRMLNMYRMEFYMELADHSMHVADLERATGGSLQ